MHYTEVMLKFHTLCAETPKNIIHCEGRDYISLKQIEALRT